MRAGRSHDAVVAIAVEALVSRDAGRIHGWSHRLFCYAHCFSPLMAAQADVGGRRE
jgi:hypothetical protein